MGLPRVKIVFENGTLGSVAAGDDGVCGLVCSGVSVENKLVLDTPYLVTSLAEIDAYGVTSGTDDGNRVLYKCVREFYDEAPPGNKLWFMVVSPTEKVSDICDYNNDLAKKLLVAAKGAVNILVIKKYDAVGATVTTTGGLDSDVAVATNKAQLLAERVTDELFAPCMVLLEGRHYTGVAGSLNSLAGHGNNRVAVVIGDTVSGSTGAAVGLIAGRLCNIPVQRSVARVKSGAIVAEVMYIGNTEAENALPALIHDAGYICPRTFVGKAGYFWSDDRLATASTDDYAMIPRRRVIDKAYRIAYHQLISELSDEIPVTADGKIAASKAKAIQDTVEMAIITTMGGDGNLGTDPEDDSDTGVECYIDVDQNIVADSTLRVAIAIRPYGYAKYINVQLGFKVEN